MPRYIVGAGSKLSVKARSSIHDTTTVWDRVIGTVHADPGALPGATATFAVDMTKFDAGDFLKNRKLKKDFAFDQHPQATFELSSVENVTQTGDRFTADARGILRWRGREVAIKLAGSGTLDATRLAATARFELDIKQLGLNAPKFLLFKVEDEVTVDVVLVGRVEAA